MYLRFGVKEIDEDSHEPMGVFHAASDLCKRLDVKEEDKEEMMDLLAWFGVNLEVPDRFAKSRKATAQSKGISWFKRGADDCIDRVVEICLILKKYGIYTRMLKTKRVGYVLYEDEDQLCAMPFRGERR